MKVWITKYALTDGIKEMEARLCKAGNGDMIEQLRDDGPPMFYYGKGRDWHDSLESAILKAEEMKAARIKSLNKQIEKLSKMSFR